MFDESANKHNTDRWHRSHAGDHCRQLIRKLRCSICKDRVCSTVPLFRGLQHDWSKRGKIEFILIDRGDDGIPGRPTQAFREHRAQHARIRPPVDITRDCADRRRTDGKPASFVAQHSSPPANHGDAAVGQLADEVRSGAGNDHHARFSSERSLERYTGISFNEKSEGLPSTSPPSHAQCFGETITDDCTADPGQPEYNRPQIRRLDFRLFATTGYKIKKIRCRALDPDYIGIAGPDLMARKLFPAGVGKNPQGLRSAAISTKNKNGTLCS